MQQNVFEDKLYLGFWGKSMSPLSLTKVSVGAVTARWLCVGLAVLLAAASCVRSSSEENFPVEGIFPMELTWVLTLFPEDSCG